MLNKEQTWNQILQPTIRSVKRDLHRGIYTAKTPSARRKTKGLTIWGCWGAQKGSIASFGATILFIVRDEKTKGFVWRTRRLGGESPFNDCTDSASCLRGARCRTGSDGQSTRDTILRSRPTASDTC